MTHADPAGVRRERLDRELARVERRGRKPGVTWDPAHVKPCGTDAAYQRHLRHGGAACDACLDAHAKRNRTRAAHRRRVSCPSQ